MAEDLEEMLDDTDRALDQNGFLNHQFEIFTHDYREKTEIPKCSEHEGGSGCCGESHEPPAKTPSKKMLVNTTRRLGTALRILNNIKGKETITDLINQLQSTNLELQKLIQAETAEFSTTSVKLPDYDPDDMELLFGKGEVAKMGPLLETVEKNRVAARERMFQVVAEAEILLNEFDYIKKHLGEVS